MREQKTKAQVKKNKNYEIITACPPPTRWYKSTTPFQTYSGMFKIYSAIFVLVKAY